MEPRYVILCGALFAGVLFEAGRDSVIDFI